MLELLVLKCTLQTEYPPRHPGNYYGTPKPPAEPSPVQPDLVDQVLFDEEFDTEVQRKRTTSVSKMDRKDSAAPEEEEEEERPPLVNGLAGERQHYLVLSFFCLYLPAPYCFSAILNGSSLFFPMYLLFSHSLLFNSQNAKTVHPFFPSSKFWFDFFFCCSVWSAWSSKREAKACVVSKRNNPSARGKIVCFFDSPRRVSSYGLLHKQIRGCFCQL